MEHDVNRSHSPHGWLLLCAFFVLAGCGDGIEPLPEGDAGHDDDDPIVVDEKGLSVLAGGVRIGIAMQFSHYAVQVFDPDSSSLFWLNDTTGFVGGGGTFYLEPECAGVPHLGVGTSDACAATSPARAYVVGLDNDFEGFTEASSAVSMREIPTLLVAQSVRILGDAECSSIAASTTICGGVASTDSAIPTSFALPITFVED